MISKSTLAAMALVAMSLASPAFAQTPPGYYYGYAPGITTATRPATSVPMLTPTSSRDLSAGHLTAMAAAGHPEAPLASSTISTRLRTTERVAILILTFNAAKHARVQ